MTLDTFSTVAADWIRLRLALYGPEDAKRLMLRAFGLSKATRINERTVLRAWADLDALIEAANKALDADAARRLAAGLPPSVEELAARAAVTLGPLQDRRIPRAKAAL